MDLDNITNEITDLLINALKDLNIFLQVERCADDELPPALSFPAAFVFFDNDDDTFGTRPTPIMNFIILTIHKNLSSGGAASGDATRILDKVRNALNGKSLGMPSPPLLRPFWVDGRSVVAAEAGAVVYQMNISVGIQLNVPPLD